MPSISSISFSDKSVFQFSMGETLLSKNLTGNGISVYSSDLSTLPWGRTNLNTRTYKKGDIVIGARGTIGSIKMPNEDNFTATQTTMVCSIIDKGAILSDFLYYFLHTVNWRGITSGAAIPMLTINAIKNLEIPLPDINTQRLIVSEIEKQFSRLDEGLSLLVRIKENLKSYRASLLKSAVEGKLTAEWRAEHPDIESADILLDRIRTARREKWLSEHPGKKYIEPEMLKGGIDGLTLPENWVYSRTEEICEFITKGTTPQSNELKDCGTIPFLKVYNLTFNLGLNLADYPKTFISDKIHTNELKRSIVYPGDILMNIVGPPFGKISIVPDLYKEYNINQAIVIFRLINGVIPKFFGYILTSYVIQSWLKKRAKTTVGQINLTLELCRDLPFPLPPLLEQHRIVEILEEKFSVIDSLESLVNANIKRAENLKQAILKKAFSGELISE